MFSTTHITATTTRDTRSVLLAEPAWRFARRRPAATTPSADAQAGIEALPDNLHEFRTRSHSHSRRTPRDHGHGQAARSGLALGVQRGGRVAMPLLVTAVAVALTASVDSIARVLLGAL